MSRPRVFILGKLPPPYFGPAIATQIILHSRLNDQYELIHINTALNKKIGSIGIFSWCKPFKGLSLYLLYLVNLFRYRPVLILIPNGQTTSAFIKDSFFILIGRLFGSDILLHLRGSNWKNWLNGVSRVTRWYVVKNLKLASGVIVLGEKLKHLFSENFPENRIFVVPNGADFIFPSKPVRKKNHSNILFFSNLMSSKGVEDVLEAAEILNRRKTVGVLFRFAGEWTSSEFRKACMDYVALHNLNVEFLPPESGEIKLELFFDAGIFVFPPRMPEGHPWVIVEAMAAGLPIISTDRGAITESVINGVNGFIVECNNPPQIAEKLEYLMNHPEIRDSMGRESRRLYEENFTEEKMVEKLAYVFNSVLRMT